METINVHIHQSDLNTDLIELLLANRIEQNKNRALIDVLAKTIANWKKQESSSEVTVEPVTVSESEPVNVYSAEEISANYEPVIAQPAIQPGQF